MAAAPTERIAHWADGFSDDDADCAATGAHDGYPSREAHGEAMVAALVKTGLVQDNKAARKRALDDLLRPPRATAAAAAPFAAVAGVPNSTAASPTAPTGVPDERRPLEAHWRMAPAIAGAMTGRQQAIADQIDAEVAEAAAPAELAAAHARALAACGGDAVKLRRTLDKIDADADDLAAKAQHARRGTHLR